MPGHPVRAPGRVGRSRAGRASRRSARDPPAPPAPSDSGIVEVSAPDIRTLYLAAEFCPEPAPGHGYQLWLGSNGEWTPVGEMFWPENGVLLREVPDVDVSQFDEVWITQEAVGSTPTEPNTDGPSWFGSLT